MQHKRHATVIGGTALILATLLFAAVFMQLARSFGYPDVLDLPAAEVLPKLLALGPSGRAVWFVYGLVPLLLVPTAFGVHAAGRSTSPLTARVAVVTAVLAAAAMTAGLMRWPSLHWQLALAWGDASPAAREGIAALFVASNSYLGNVVGEFLGELFLNAFFAAAALMLPNRWLRAAGLAAAALGWAAMLRNALGGLDTVAALNNIVLPIWMLVLGVALLRRKTGET